MYDNSKIRDKKGNLLKVYHGSGTRIKTFDNSFTGKGNDQYGSGFYFTTDKATAEMYTTKRIHQNISKLGGEDSPTVIEAYLNICNPIIINGITETNLKNVKIPSSYIFNILKELPSLYLSPDSEEEVNPLGDYFEDFWEQSFRQKEDYIPFIKRLYMEYFSEASLLDLEILFKDYSTELRLALKKICNYDGIIINFKNSKHIIAWFPNQIKIL